MLRNLPLGIPSLAFIGLLLFRSCAPMILPNESVRPVSLSGRPDLYCWNRQLGISSDSPVCVGVHICVCMRHPIPESVQTEAVLLLSSLNTGTKRLSLCSRLTLPLCHPRCRAAPSGNARQCNFKKKKKDLAIVRMWNGKSIFSLRAKTHALLLRGRMIGEMFVPRMYLELHYVNLASKCARRIIALFVP